MQKMVSLCKRRSFIFQSSEIYGGLRSCYDYGPLGVELKRNVKDQWWRTVVHGREDVVGIDASIIMHPRVWEASGHVSGFTDPLVDCKKCKGRFRADKISTETASLKCPDCGNEDPKKFSEIRRFNLMFETHLGAVEDSASVVYLRPETAQAMFVDFEVVQAAGRLKLPFGIAQIGKSFRNEIVVEHFIFRSCEFEQMEVEYFTRPGEADKWFEHWKEERISWYTGLGIRPEKLRFREHSADERAHYAQACFDIDYEFPWGWDELEGIANRTDYDLKKHSEASGKDLTYFDPQTHEHITPYVIEPSAGADRSVLAFLLDAYTEEPPPPGTKNPRTVLRLDPRLAPTKVAVLPLKKNKPELVAVAREIVRGFFEKGINAFYDEKDSIGRRYRRQDESGTPFCITVDFQSLKDRTVTIRHRDSMKQDRIGIEDATPIVADKVF